MGAARSSAARVLRPEVRLLLRTVRADGPGTEEASGPWDWAMLKALMVRERASAVAWSRLRPEVRDAAPPEVARHFRRVAAVAEFRQIQLMRRLDEALEQLPPGVDPPVLLKGAALALSCYSDPTQRPMLDVDVLVGESAAGDWHRRLRRAGWSWDEDRYPAKAYRRHFHLPPLEDARGTGAVLELHTGLFIPGHPFALDASTLRAHSDVRDMGGAPVLIPRPAVHLVYISLHFAWSHALSTGAWRTFRDVAALSGSQGFEWSDFLELAHASGGASCCYWTLRLATSLADVGVPGQVLEALRPPLQDAVLAGLERHFALQLFPVDRTCPSVSVERMLWRLALRTGDAATDPGRPWEHAGDFRSASSTPRTGIGRLVAQVRALPAWIRYLRTVLDGGPDARDTG